MIHGVSVVFQNKCWTMRIAAKGIKAEKIKKCWNVLFAKLANKTECKAKPNRATRDGWKWKSGEGKPNVRRNSENLIMCERNEKFRLWNANVQMILHETQSWHKHPHTHTYILISIGFHTVHMLLLFLLHFPKDWQIKLSWNLYANKIGLTGSAAALAVSSECWCSKCIFYIWTPTERTYK